MKVLQKGESLTEGIPGLFKMRLFESQKFYKLTSLANKNRENKRHQRKNMTFLSSKETVSNTSPIAIMRG